MKVLHYMFGVPPVRAGGLVRYAMDLMRQEQRMGIEVYLLLPGNLPRDARKKTKVRKSRKTGVHVPAYEIYHPLPIPMCNGIVDIEGFTSPCGGRVFQDFLQEMKPDLIHIHTFMGLHREFLVQARKMGIPVLFTTHDYFGICPTAVMLDKGHLCKDWVWENCGECCRNAFSPNRLWLEQSEGYRLLRKQEWIVTWMKWIARYAGKGNENKNDRIRDRKKKGTCGKSRKESYAVLKRYYVSMFGMVSWFHFNSTLAKKIYEDRLGPSCKGSVVGISHAGIADHRRIRHYGKTLRLGYFGSWARHKGFFVLLEACGRLYEKGCTDLELHLYSSTENRKEAFVRMHPNFTADQLGEVFCGIDVLVMPSVWPETFGLAALEAVSYGVPVVLSEYTGAKDILQESGFVYDGTRQGLEKTLQEIYGHRELLGQMNAHIMDNEYDFSFRKHVREMIKLYQKLGKWELENSGRQV